MGYCDCLFSNQWYACLVPLQQFVGCATQIVISRILGPALLTTAHLLILGITYIFFMFILPAVAGDSLLLVPASILSAQCAILTFFAVLDKFRNWLLPISEYNVQLDIMCIHLCWIA